RGRSQIASTSESHGGDLIIQRYDRSGWRVGLLQCSHSLKGARQVRGQGRPSNFAFSTTKRMGEVEYPISLTYPAEELCISSFDYSTTAAESGWEPKGVLQPKQKIDDSAKCEVMQRLHVFAGAEQCTRLFNKIEQSKGMVISETSRGKDMKRKVASIGQISKRDKSWFSKGRIVCRTAHIEEYLKTKTPQSLTDRASDEESLHDLA
ncbi:hypothetical protein GW17_00052294, partial [Ensete ventricosum]